MVEDQHITGELLLLLKNIKIKKKFQAREIYLKMIHTT